MVVVSKTGANIYPTQSGLSLSRTTYRQNRRDGYSKSSGTITDVAVSLQNIQLFKRDGGLTPGIPVLTKISENCEEHLPLLYYVPVTLFLCVSTVLTNWFALYHVGWPSLGYSELTHRY
ncbi:hypothetical protein HD806DRAFT_102430 [Xylariaceae sp. AK1471]|nr:hypothetical protein HD806DRAFT_102430 [Xylariaceae sp. AK1471]